MKDKRVMAVQSFHYSGGNVKIFTGIFFKKMLKYEPFQCT